MTPEEEQVMAEVRVELDRAAEERKRLSADARADLAYRTMLIGFHGNDEAGAIKEIAEMIREAETRVRGMVTRTLRDQEARALEKAASAVREGDAITANRERLRSLAIEDALFWVEAIFAGNDIRA